MRVDLVRGSVEDELVPVDLSYKDSTRVWIREDYCWVDSALFAIGGASMDSTPREVLDRLLIDDHYVNAYQLADRVAGEVDGQTGDHKTQNAQYLAQLRDQNINPEDDPMRTGYPALWVRLNATGDEHGPYQLSKITADTFDLLDGATGRQTLLDWVYDGDEVEAHPLTIEGDLDAILDQLARAPVLFRLQDLGEQAQHAAGFVVDPYLEFVVVDLAAGQLRLIACGGD